MRSQHEGSRDHGGEFRSWAVHDASESDAGGCKHCVDVCAATCADTEAERAPRGDGDRPQLTGTDDGTRGHAGCGGSARSPVLLAL